jgi:nicotinate-nucleotide pyrophosphorylase
MATVAGFFFERCGLIQQVMINDNLRAVRGSRLSAIQDARESETLVRVIDGIDGVFQYFNRP